MIKLSPQSDKNSPAAYDAIFKERQLKGVDEHDMRRWKRLLKHYKGGTILDLGCLDSCMPELLKKFDYSWYVGVDTAHDSIYAMREKYHFERAQFFVGDLFKLSKSQFNEYYGGELFDYAILGEVLEHLERPEDAIKEAMRILKPGGVLAISTPLEEAREPGAIDGDRHLWSFSKLDLETMLMPYGRVELDTVGSLFTWKPPFYRYCWPSLIAFCTKS